LRAQSRRAGATTNRDDHVVSLARGRRMVRDADGVHDQGPLDGDVRRRALIEEFGRSEQVADLLPPDEPLSR
jgi:hypothetical protein